MPQKINMVFKKNAYKPKSITTTVPTQTQSISPGQSVQPLGVNTVSRFNMSTIFAAKGRPGRSGG